MWNWPAEMGTRQCVVISITIVSYTRCWPAIHSTNKCKHLKLTIIYILSVDLFQSNNMYVSIQICSVLFINKIYQMIKELGLSLLARPHQNKIIYFRKGNYPKPCSKKNVITIVKGIPPSLFLQYGYSSTVTLL